MSTVTDVRACPLWCRLAPGHDWDSIHDDGHKSRGHAGPVFGEFVSTGWREHQDGTVDEFGIGVDMADDPDELLSPQQARQFAADLLAAAEWQEAHPTPTS